VSAPTRLQEPVLPATVTDRPADADRGLTEVITGALVTVTVTVAVGQAACRSRSTTEPQ
jgi:hypothetical protein